MLDKFTNIYSLSDSRSRYLASKYIYYYSQFSEVHDEKILTFPSADILIIQTDFINKYAIFFLVRKMLFWLKL